MHDAKVQQLYEVLQHRWPQTFGEDVAAIRPLAIGIDRDLVAQLSAYPRWAVKQALTRWLRKHQVRYWQTVIKGGPRYDLEGQVRGEVAAEQQAHAKQRRAEWFAHRRLAKGQTVACEERPSQPRAEGSE
jgi:sRNA-binding protein